MSGHSKFANIKHKKEKNDAAKGKIFTIIGREIAVAVKEGGPDPANNFKLATVIAKAKANNIPKDNINRAIQKGLGASEGESYEELTYEGYGPGGVAVIVEAMTDNRNRTASEVRHGFDKYNGNLGATNCVSWSFDRKGVIVVDNEDEELDEETVLMDAMEAGAADMETEEGVFTLYTVPADVTAVAEYMTSHGYKLLSAQEEMVPQSYVTLTAEGDIKNMQKMLDAFEDNDDVQNVWHNWENNE